MFAVSGNPLVVQLFIGPVKCTSFSLQYVNCWQQGAAADGPRWAVLKPQGCSSTSPGQYHCHCGTMIVMYSPRTTSRCNWCQLFRLQGTICPNSA